MKLKDPTPCPALSRSVGHVDISSAHRAAHLKRDCGCSSSARELLQVLLRWKLDALMLTIFVWISTW